MKVISVNIGPKKQVVWKNKSVETGIFKTPTEEAIYLNTQQVRNDAIADRKVHGGIEKAVYAFGANHYPFYKERYPNLAWTFGMFGENLTLDFLDETTINIGDIYELGKATLQVSQPRQPCFKLGIKFNDQAVLKTMWTSAKTGLYFRVLVPGMVAKNDSLTLLKANPIQYSIADHFVGKKLRKD